MQKSKCNTCHYTRYRKESYYYCTRLKAFKEGFKVLFINTAEIMDKLVKTVDEGIIEKELKKFYRVDLLIIGGLRYININKK
ncbi:MAG: ATP-binding protein [Zhenhengia sp.]|uniref:ATP-binding protein n=1 Tax=Zhenhengia sp. TaxID=2944208 RepID=UPI003991D6CA